ncbi:MAG: Fic family protein [Actinomycetota bacterium]|nr:Fic family protein [Actinomycetota bacterium]
MSYEPQFSITPSLLAVVEEIARLRQRIEDASVELAWIPALRKDTRTRNAHASTAIEGNPLTLAEVRALADGTDVLATVPRSQREVINYFAGLGYVERHSADKRITHEDLFGLHRILANGVMDQGEAGSYRVIRVRVGRHVPPAPDDVGGLMSELLEWWNGPSTALSPVISSAVIHYRFEAIHPFADGNGRAGRALALWELYRRGFDTHHIFSVDEYYWEDRLAYYAALDHVRGDGEDLTGWLEYCAEGLRLTLERVWTRIQTIAPDGTRRLVLRPKQERLLNLLTAQGSMSPSEIWEALGVSRQGAMDLINPLMEAGLIEKVGTKKTGRYRLTKP